jgi:hypothetical protein
VSDLEKFIVGFALVVAAQVVANLVTNKVVTGNWKGATK